MSNRLNDSPCGSPTIQDEVDFLSDPSTYPGKDAPVTTIETHMAWVFLVGDEAYKLKKCIKRPGMDYSTRAARRHDAFAEVRLNRRLAPTIYRGVQRITRGPDGALRLNEDGDVVDWVVHMRRVPGHASVHAHIEADSLTRSHIRAVADRLSRFYRDSPTVGLNPSAYIERFHSRLDFNEDVLRTPAYALNASLISDATERLRNHIDGHASDLSARASRVVDGHGDLRPEHVYLQPYPLVIDCIAFDRGLRLLDPADELSFLSMECTQLGAEWVGPELFDVYSDITGDHPTPSLISFYQAQEACTRARLAIWHLDDGDDVDAAHWRNEAERYLLTTVAEMERAKP
ncbi:hypothetical protein CRI94_13100 [Longibacter salinarum]|uniref:Aminoglycoside phosphotransferase domain-containing protein n=1 Tax=Longibacter salinarum TaxID=1850348 RepID=A0A2A8CWG2_9BACT|nr:hypothetical protein [Longibacter salinarum]PEN12934.1 hypothetical protein CRI94_13100 [Longibacter salinarum]